MKKISCYIFLLINFLIYSAKAEIAYIDINHILKTSEVGKHLNSHISKKKNEFSIKFKEIEDELIKKEKLLLEQQNILSKEEFQKKIKLLTKEVQDYKKNKQSNIDYINQLKIEKTKEILKELNPIIANFVDINSISIVMPKKNIIVGKKNLDITEKILNLLNKNIVKLNF